MKKNESAAAVGEFARRHLGPSDSETARMLEFVGAESLDALVREAMPPAIFDDNPPDLGQPLSEREALAALAEAADENAAFTSMIGLGYYGTETPAVARRGVLENPGWYTAYTPYQPEISQGRLEMLLNFQTAIADLTALPMANASLLDEATAAAEAMTLLRRSNKKSDGAKFLVHNDIFPQTLAVLKTRAKPMEIEIVLTSPDKFAENSEGAFGAFFCYPSADGKIADYSAVVSQLREKGIGCACATDLLALALVIPPGEMGFDVAVGSSQRFGVSLGFGGPHAAFMAFRKESQRFTPGRIVGVSRDSRGRRAHRLALQTREQHIRREKATSNICTAQVLPAVMAACFAVYHGGDGVRDIANRVHRHAAALARGLAKLGFSTPSDSFFDTLRIVADDAEKIVGKARDESQINLLLADEKTVGISADELTTSSHIAAVLRAFGGKGDEGDDENAGAIPESLLRKSDYLTHSVFRRHRTEFEMLRYLRRLAAKDIALDRSMIPLGSCTMKLNAAAEMTPITWRNFADIHPFAPPNQSRGYRRVMVELADLLARLTGFDSVSLQPNAGSQGEFSGLLAIRHYHDSRGESHRRVCLIPDSAHGTNPASAIMAGMTVESLGVHANGSINTTDLREKIEKHGDNLAALMVTYPSTCGVFGARIVQVCEIIHQAGGQVYMDGANLNALVGVARPGKFGADVSHINLHKTFCIPHGGGGPGMGPIGVKSHLAPFLPNHPLENEAGPATGPGAVSAAPWGSPLILLISYLYIRMMGGDGLRRATQLAILNANYAAKRIAPAYPLVYRGLNNRVAHECVADPRPLKKTAAVGVEDIAKRLVDYGYHAPTVSFPVMGAMMIEPTESESQSEIDRFCDALLSIRQEIAKVENGEWPQDDNPLINAPHPAADLLGEWNHSYSREEAAYPSAENAAKKNAEMENSSANSKASSGRGIREDKYWPPVSRIDQVWGDRNLICTCPPDGD